MAYSRRQFEDMEEDVESDFADMIDFLLSILTTKDGDFVTLAGDTPARTRWRVGRMASRWKGEIERLQAESQQVIDNSLRRAKKKYGNARVVELQMAAKHVAYIGQLETAYREIRRLANIVWPLHGMTLVKRLRGEGRVKSASAIGKQGGAVVNQMLQKYLDGVEIPSISSVVTTQPPALPSSTEPITPTPTPETRRGKRLSKETIREMLESGEEFEITEDGEVVPVDEDKEKAIEEAMELVDEDWDDATIDSIPEDEDDIPEDELELTEEEIEDALEWDEEDE